MPKKAKLTNSTKKNSDFSFIVTVSVFAAVTVFAANYLAKSQQEAALAAKNQALPVAQLDIASPSPEASVKPTPKPTPQLKYVPLPTPIQYHNPVKK